MRKCYYKFLIFLSINDVFLFLWYNIRKGQSQIKAKTDVELTLTALPEGIGELP